jgi:hypothetical protein
MLPLARSAAGERSVHCSCSDVPPFHCDVLECYGRIQLSQIQTEAIDSCSTVLCTRQLSSSRLVHPIRNLRVSAECPVVHTQTIETTDQPTEFTPTAATGSGSCTAPARPPLAWTNGILARRLLAAGRRNPVQMLTHCRALLRGHHVHSTAIISPNIGNLFGNTGNFNMQRYVSVETHRQHAGKTIGDNVDFLTRRHGMTFRRVMSVGLLYRLS